MKNKVFCIGMGKTGTTSLHHLFKSLEYEVASQSKFEKTLNDYIYRKWEKIAKKCEEYNFFQDVPFCLPYLYMYLDQTFPNSKFILSIRDNSEQWYNSLINAHSRIIDLSNIKEIKNFKYRYDGWLYDLLTSAFNTTEEDLYDKNKLVFSYNKHNETVQDYFKSKDNLIKINLAKREDFGRLMSFLNIKTDTKEFPHMIPGPTKKKIKNI